MDEILIPLFGIVMIIAIVIGPIWIRSYFTARDRAAMQVTLRAAIEKGQPMPPELIAALQTNDGPVYRGAESDLRRGLVLLFTGLGLGVLGYGLWFGLASVAGNGPADIVGGVVAGAGGIPGLIGVAYLILYSIRRRTPAE